MLSGEPDGQRGGARKIRHLLHKYQNKAFLCRVRVGQSCSVPALMQNDIVLYRYCTQPPLAEANKLHHEGSGAPHPMRVGGVGEYHGRAELDLLRGRGGEGLRDVWLVIEAGK